jgi:hypothetical protein
VIEWFTAVAGYGSALIGLATVIIGLAGRKPDDISFGGVVLVELLLIAQIIISLVAPAFGNLPTGSGLEYWVYLITAAVIPPLAVLWGLIERNRWSTVVLGVAALAVAVMIYRMHQIWFVQTA